ncbi:MAG: periplasmic heavy metal sensor [Verrucomicrobiae bacterium]|nr:periplasmic heavy metal sensor [Verrucomicrobiae bacterium]
MKGRHRIALALVVVTLGAGIFAASHGVTSRAWHFAAGQDGDQLAWLCREFAPPDEALAQIRKLHDGYQPKCDQMSSRIAAKNQELAAVLATQRVGPEVEQKLQELAALRAECQAEMLRHFQDVAGTLPPQQGERYLREMQRLALGIHGPGSATPASQQPRDHERP